MPRGKKNGWTETVLLWILPLTVFLALASGQLWVWHSASALSQNLVESESSRAAEQIALKLDLLLFERGKDISHLASLWQLYAPGTREERFFTDARGISSRERDYQSIGFINADGSVHLVTPSESKSALMRADSRAVVLNFARGGDTLPEVFPYFENSDTCFLIIYHPIYIQTPQGRQFLGAVGAALFLESTFSRAITGAIPTRFRIQITIDGQVVYVSKDYARDFEKNEIQGETETSFRAFRRSFVIRIAPPRTRGLLQALQRENLVRLIINSIATLLASALIAVALFATLRSHQSRRELEQSEGRYQRLTENAHEMIFRLRLPDGRYEYVSPASFELLGYAPSAFYDDRDLIKKIVDPQWQEHFNKQWELLLRGDPPATFEFKVKHKSGETRWLSQRTIVVRHEEDLPVAIEAVVTDITERKKIAEERERLISELEAKNADLERFTYTVSHELKTPLITIRGFLGYLEQEAATGDLTRLHEDLVRIQSATETMRRQLNDLIELNRIGRIQGESEDIDMSELCRQAVELLADRIREQGVEVHISDEMPAVHGYRTELLELYKILIENAVKFMGTQNEPFLDIGWYKQDSDVIFFVRDNGIGLDQRYKERIFGLFNKLNPQTEGTGVGLALARRIVMLHGGWIRAESEGSGKGTVFLFKLPLSVP